MSCHFIIRRGGPGRNRGGGLRKISRAREGSTKNLEGKRGGLEKKYDEAAGGSTKKNLSLMAVKKGLAFELVRGLRNIFVSLRGVYEKFLFNDGGSTKRNGPFENFDPVPPSDNKCQVPKVSTQMHQSQQFASSTSPHLWLADGDSLMCYIVRTFEDNCLEIQACSGHFPYIS